MKARPVRPPVETCGTNSTAGISAATPLPNAVAGTPDANPWLWLVRRAAPPPARCGLPGDNGSDDDDLRCSGWLPTSVHSVRPSGATIESSLTGVAPNVACRSASTFDVAAGVDAAGGKIVEGRHRRCDPGFGQRHVAPRRQIEFFAALPFDQSAEPNVQRCHRRSRQDHADGDRYEQLASRRHPNPTQNASSG